MAASPLIKYTHQAAVLPPLCFGSVEYYAAMAQYQRVYVDVGMRYDKRFKQAHRYEIVDARGRLSLTVPCEKVTNKAAHQGITWAQVLVSDHGEWWAKHMTALESAYGRTPFFEYYIDQFKPWIADLDCSVADLDIALDKIVRSLLGLETQVEYTRPPISLQSTGAAICSSDAAIDSSDATIDSSDAAIVPSDTAIDSSDAAIVPSDAAIVPSDATIVPSDATIAPSDATIDSSDAAIVPSDAAICANGTYPGIHTVEYYQVRADRLGFQPGLSILDLLFNMGPESPLILKEMQLPLL